VHGLTVGVLVIGGVLERIRLRVGVGVNVDSLAVVIERAFGYSLAHLIVDVVVRGVDLGLVDVRCWIGASSSSSPHPPSTTTAASAAQMIRMVSPFRLSASRPSVEHVAWPTAGSHDGLHER
jgi:hypothetical protein